MMKNGYTDHMTAWDLLMSGLEAHQDDLPYLEPYRTQLKAALAALRALQITRAALAEESLQGTLNLKAGLAQAEDLASRLRNGVLAYYGHHSDKLTEFGIKTAGRARKPGARKNPTAP
jgi:hypothetical protein